MEYLNVYETKVTNAGLVHLGNSKPSANFSLANNCFTRRRNAESCNSGNEIVGFQKRPRTAIEETVQPLKEQTEREEAAMIEGQGKAITETAASVRSSGKGSGGSTGHIGSCH